MSFRQLVNSFSPIQKLLGPFFIFFCFLQKQGWSGLRSECVRDIFVHINLCYHSCVIIFLSWIATIYHACSNLFPILYIWHICISYFIAFLTLSPRFMSNDVKKNLNIFTKYVKWRKIMLPLSIFNESSQHSSLPLVTSVYQCPPQSL